MSTCDSTEIEACLVPDTVADTTMSCEKPVMTEASAAAKISIEQSSSTEEQQGTLIALEEVPEHDCDAVDGDVIPHQDSSVPLEGLVADDVLVENHSFNVVEQECSPEPDSAVELPKNEADIMPVEGCFEDEAQGENQSPPVNETPTEIPTPEQQRKAARLAKEEVTDEETTGVDGSQSTVAEEDGSLVINKEDPTEASTAAEETTKPKKLNSKQRKAKARRLEAEKVGASASAETTVVVKSSSPVTVAVVETEGVAQKKKKLTSTERRAHKLAQESEKSETESIPVEDVAPTETPGDSAKTESADNVVVKTKKLGSKQRKAKQRAAEAAQAAATLAGLANVVPAATSSAVNPDSAAVVAAAPEGGSNEAPARKKLTSTERRAKRDAKLAALEATPPTDPPASSPVAVAAAAPVTTAATISASAQEESEGVPKARKLNSKQRKALRLARERTEAEAEAETSTAEVISSFLVKPAAPAQEVVEKAPKANPAPKKTSVVNPHTGTTAGAVTTKQMTGDQSIALHATLAVLRQGLLSRDSVIYTQQGAMKMHLLTELCKLGYPCIEGNANSFQQITWCGTNQCLTYTTAIVNAPQQYPATLRAKGELKIAVPGLSVQLKCYPTFGAGSPALMGHKNFRNGFVRHFDEVAARETDAFVFVLPVGVYHQYAREAVMTLPAAQNIHKHLSGHGVKYVTKNQDEVTLCGVFCSVETLYGEFIVGSVAFA